MRTVTIILLSLLAFSLQAADLLTPMLTDEWSIRSDLTVGHPVPVQFVSKLTRDQLAKTPAWQEGSEYPPLSPRKAEGLALAMLHRIAGGRHWTPDISLRAFDVTQGSTNYREIRWFYVLNFDLSLPMADFEGGSLNIIVLMDGTAIEPQKLEYKSIERYDYPGLGHANYSTMYAFSWEKQLNLYQKQGWSMDSVTFITNKMGAAAVIRLQRLEKLEQKSSNTALEPTATAP